MESQYIIPEELKNTINIINSLPKNVSNEIYNEFNMSRKLLKYFLQNVEKFDTNENKEEMINVTTQILNTPYIVNYLLKTNHHFQKSYDYHYVQEKRLFKKLTTVESFILCISKSMKDQLSRV